MKMKCMIFKPQKWFVLNDIRNILNNIKGEITSVEFLLRFNRYEDFKTLLHLFTDSFGGILKKISDFISLYPIFL